MYEEYYQSVYATVENRKTGAILHRQLVEHVKHINNKQEITKIDI